MADQHHLDLLKRGVDTWNKWKKEHPDIEADLCGANLRRVSLIRAAFSRTDPIRADPGEANHIKLNYSNTNLLQANLSVWYFMAVELSRAHLRRTNPS